MDVNRIKNTVMSVFGLIVVIMLCICIGTFPLHAQSFEYYNGKKVIDGVEVVKDNFPFDDTMIVDRIYYPITHELTLEIRMFHNYWNEDSVEFATYCAIMNFIEDATHRYYDYSIVSRKTYNNKDKTQYDLRVVKCVLRE